jgi:hypothetical protein
MANYVRLNVAAGPMKGEAFAFEEHDTFLFGRLEECHCCLPDDGQVSQFYGLHKSYRRCSICAQR